MPLRFFNTLSREVEDFSPIEPAGKQVKMYTCGPTVYNHAHIGNFRAYVFEDLLQRHLEARGYFVERVMNLTDVDDKTIRDSRKAGRALADFTQIYKDAFFQDIAMLRIARPAETPSATEPRFIEKMIAMIGQLVREEIAYVAEDRSVYFRLSKFPKYGQLAHLNLDELRPSGRVSSDEYEKENIGDFALWKAWDEADGDVRWDSPWGPGRPGWHIECSAMATALLGPEIDIHCGGVDNIFPHHEAEIAQSECCTGKTFVRYWLHCAHLMVEGQKMSKSLGNFYTLRDLTEKGFAGREVRYALLTVNYRLPCNFTIAGLEAARVALGRIDEWLERLRTLADREKGDLHGSDELTTSANLQIASFFEALDDDLNISGAMGHLFELIRSTNKAMDEASLSGDQAGRLLAEWDRVESVLALRRDVSVIPDDLMSLVEQRQQARAEKNWALSDELRDRIAALGWVVKDTKDGAKLTPR